MSTLKVIRHYHNNWWRVADDNVWYLAGRAPDNPELKVGAWYFSDEAGLMNGPFATLEECDAALKDYVASL